MIIVSDSTTLIILDNQNRFDLLSNLFIEVLVPRAVFLELSQKQSFKTPDFIKIEDAPCDDELESLKLLLDDGESEAIRLAHLKTLPLIIDEKKGRKIAQNMGIKIIGLLGVIYLNIKRGFLSIDEARLFLDSIKMDGFRISQTLIDDMFESLLL